MLLRNGHLNTIYTSLFRKAPNISFERKRISTHDEDFLDLDYIRNGNKRIAILCHGLEGSSASKYISGISEELLKINFDICAMNYRFCSGEINLTPQLYHSGYTIDLHTTVQEVEKNYDSIAIIGFSLGGNLLLKYLGDGALPLSKKIHNGCAISAPIDLHGSSIVMKRLQNFLYTRRFLKSLFQKLKLKNKQFPEIFNLKFMSQINNVMDFDDYYTGPLNGFKDAIDYYTQCSSLQFLSNINLPTLLVNSYDDPFLSKNCYPKRGDLDNNENLTLEYPRYGGHVGFYQKGSTWNEKRIIEFLDFS